MHWPVDYRNRTLLYILVLLQLQAGRLQKQNYVILLEPVFNYQTCFLVLFSTTIPVDYRNRTILYFLVLFFHCRCVDYRNRIMLYLSVLFSTTDLQITETELCYIYWSCFPPQACRLQKQNYVIFLGSVFHCRLTVSREYFKSTNYVMFR